MGKHATKAGENIFTQARYNAAKFNDRLNSREGASEELGIDRSRLARIELGSKECFSARYSAVEIDAEAEAEGHIYCSKLTGTDPKVSVRSAESDNGVVPEVSTEAYQIRYKLCGDAFEI